MVLLYDVFRAKKCATVYTTAIQNMLCYRGIYQIYLFCTIIIFYLLQTRIDRMTRNLHSIIVVLFHPSYTIHWYSAKNVLKARCPLDKMKDRSSAASVPSSVHYRTRHLLLESDLRERNKGRGTLSVEYTIFQETWTSRV